MAIKLYYYYVFSYCLPVRNAESLDTSIDGQYIGHMSVVEPEPGRVHQHCPVVGVAALEELLHRLHLKKSHVGRQCRKITSFI